MDDLLVESSSQRGKTWKVETRQREDSDRLSMRELEMTRLTGELDLRYEV